MSEKPIDEFETPISIIWDEILFASVVGILDSNRTQKLMDNILEKIAATESRLLLFDILGIPSVDSSVANHIIKITKATRLMGCDTIISGMSPGIAQTITQLGINLADITTTTTIKNAFKIALDKLDLEVVKKSDIK